MDTALRSGITIGIAVVLGGCGDPGTAPGGTETPSASISVMDNAFDPRGSSIKPGESVRWTWSGSNQHTVTFDDAGIGNSGSLTQGTFTKRFVREGLYSYFCSVHGRNVMAGTVTVQNTPITGGTPTGYP